MHVKNEVITSRDRPSRECHSRDGAKLESMCPFQKGVGDERKHGFHENVARQKGFRPGSGTIDDAEDQILIRARVEHRWHSQTRHRRYSYTQTWTEGSGWTERQRVYRKDPGRCAGAGPYQHRRTHAAPPTWGARR